MKADLFDIRRRLRGTGKIRAILRPAYPDFTDKGEFLAAMSALEGGGVREFAFYNWGHIRKSSLAWIGEAMKS